MKKANQPKSRPNIESLLKKKVFFIVLVPYLELKRAQGKHSDLARSGKLARDSKEEEKKLTLPPPSHIPTLVVKSKTIKTSCPFWPNHIFEWTDRRRKQRKAQNQGDQMSL
jgi:hypothetical protein